MSLATSPGSVRYNGHGRLASVRAALPRGVRLSWLGLAIVATYAAVALLAPHLAPYHPSAYAGSPLERPSSAHWLGTNDVGQDILSEIVYGTRVSLMVGLFSAAMSLGAALLVGSVAGYVSGWPDVILMRLIDVLMAMPHLPLMIVLATYLSPTVWSTILVIALLAWPVPARAIRAQTLSLRSRGFISAARLFGARPLYVMVRHLVPALAPILTATFVSLAARGVMLEAGLAFLGLGDPLTRSWGTVIRMALSYNGIFFASHWVWWLIPAAANITLLVLAFSLLGIDLETKVDTRLSRHV